MHTAMSSMPLHFSSEHEESEEEANAEAKERPGAAERVAAGIAAQASSRTKKHRLHHARSAADLWASMDSCHSKAASDTLGLLPVTVDASAPSKLSARIDRSVASRILLISLLDKFCSLYSKRIDKNKRLYDLLCRRLALMGVLEKNDSMLSGHCSPLASDFFRKLIMDSIEELDTTEAKMIEGGPDASLAPSPRALLELQLPLQQESAQPATMSTLCSSSSASLSRSSSSYDFSIEKESLTLRPTSSEAFFKPSSRYLDDFAQLDRLGRGAFGSVYKAQNKLDGNFYAVKKVDLKNMPLPPENFLREVKSLARLDHLNIVRYHSAWLELTKDKSDDSSAEVSDLEESGPLTTTTFAASADHSHIALEPFRDPYRISLYIQMQLCQGTLKDWLMLRNSLIYKSEPLDASGHLKRMAVEREDGKRTVHAQENLRIFRHIVDGLNYIHSQGLIHRDLKPQNILFHLGPGNDMIPKIGDFGLVALNRGSAVAAAHSATILDTHNGPETSPSLTVSLHASAAREQQHTLGVGTVTYSSPEQLNQTFYNEKTDIYSLGIILFELFYPFYSGMERVDVLGRLRSTISLPKEFEALWPNEARLIKQCLAPDSSCRPSTQDILQLAFLETPGLEEILSHLESQLTEKDKEIEELKEIISRQQEIISSGQTSPL